MESKNEFYLLAIVAIVAIVGIIVLVMGTNNAPVATYTNDVLGEDMAGQAFLNCADCLQYCAGLGFGEPTCMADCSRRGWRYCASGAN